jgi:acyl-CoA thioester hydrolase
VSRLHPVSVELEVPLHDVDLLGIVWHGHYLKYLEIARTALMRARGLDEPQLRELGVAFVVMESRLRHTGPLRYGDRFTVDAWFRSITDRIEIGYRARTCSTAEKPSRGVLRASTTLVTTDGHTHILREIPDAIASRIQS